MKAFTTMAAAVALLLANPGCKDGKGTAVDAVVDVEEEDAPSEADTAVDTGEDGTLDVQEEEPASPTDCEILGLPARPFLSATPDPGLFALAADFSVPTTEGMWTLSENWTGCDVILIVQDVPAQEESWGVSIWDRDVPALFARLPRNVQLLFVSTDPAWVTRQQALVDLEADVTSALSSMDPGDRAWWEARVHYVTQQDTQLGGWLQTNMRDYGWGVGIDRFQRIRFVGSYADPTRYNASVGWFAPNLSMVANEAIHYNFEADREARLDAQGATVVEVFDAQIMSDPGWTGTRSYATVTLPNAAAMEGFDSMELDLTLGCVGAGERGFCPAWDYIVHLYLCDESDPDTCDVELGRWITTYHRYGRWVHDLSALLPLFSGGGERRFAFYTQQEYEVTLDIRLFDAGKPLRPVQATYLFGGRSFDASYNDAYAPVTLPIPPDAAAVEIASAITGHGGADPGNCAEFCNTTHHFFVNGTENVRSFPEASTGTDCMDKVGEGTVPNQYGTWWYGRSGWCPGKEVPLVSIDVTGQVTFGTDATFDYEGYYLGSPYPGTGASIVMTSWLVIYR